MGIQKRSSNMSADGYKDPDDVFEYTDGDALAFLYHPTFGLDAQMGTTHPFMLRQNHKDWVQKAEKVLPEDDYDLYERREWLEGHMLMGRAGYVQSDYDDSDQFIISFWNQNTDVYDHLGACLKELEPHVDEYAEDGIEIHTPHGISEYKSAETERQNTTELSPEQLKKLKLRKRLHLMRGDEKKQARKELGLLGDPVKHPWQSELEKSGNIGPGQKWWAQHSESVDPGKVALLIREGAFVDVDDLVTPDDLYPNAKGATFIYTRHHQLHIAPGNYTHQQLEDEIQDNYEDEALIKYLRQAGDQTQLPYRDFMLNYIALYGRAGTRKEFGHRFIISFWNEESGLYDLLGGCIKELEHKNVLPHDRPVEIHTPFDISGYDVSSKDTERKRETSLDQKERFELSKRLHLAKGAEKRLLMKKLGLLGDPVKNPWQSELEKSGDIGPGQKWWAQHSEQIENIAQSINESL